MTQQHKRPTDVCFQQLLTCITYGSCTTVLSEEHTRKAHHNTRGGVM